MRKLFMLLLLLPFVAMAQTKPITLEDIYKKGTFRGEFVPAVFDNTKKEPELKTDGLKDENGTPFGHPDEEIASPSHNGRWLLKKGTEPIYRRSSKSFVYLFDEASGKLSKLEEEKLLHPGFSPDGSKIAYVKANNLYIYDIATAKATAVTTDGKWNGVINGNCDWVYEEEFEFTRAYDWSPKGNYLAYYRFDESQVKDYNLTIYDNAHNKDYRYKYPKAGDSNSNVDIYIYDVANRTKAKAQYEQGDIYIPRIKWTRDDNTLVVYWMNRHQNDLKLLATNAVTGASTLLYQETNKYYVEINDDWWFLKDGRHFLFTSEMNGYKHLYLYSLDGKTKIQLTKGSNEVTEVNAVDEANKRIYFTMAWPRPMDRNVFVTDFAGKKTWPLTQGEAWHRVEFNDDFTKFFDYRSDLNTPQTVTLNKVVADKKKGISAILEKTVNESAKLRGKMEEYGYGKAEFIRVPNSKGDTLNGWMLKPAGFDPSKKYPVLFCNYGGPGSQQVANRFGAVSSWHQLLAQKGFIVVSVDNTGTGFRGEEFKKKTYLQLGKFEIEDQIDAAKYLGAMPFVDKDNIGHWGWSFGGFMSSLAITKGNEVFSAAVAVAPVTNWRYYDNIYTERYMRTPEENAKGYDDNSPVNFTDRIKGKYLIIHGTADDNVHFQNATQMITALVKSNIDFESAYYPNKNHGIGGQADNTTFHLWSKMTNWILNNMGNANTQKAGSQGKQPRAF
ncbi:MAG: S9 family peptidase [Sphingobacteriales bacterium]|nr:S9 family peptidase [Sphingobacteriales bacterium]